MSRYSIVGCVYIFCVFCIDLGLVGPFVKACRRIDGRKLFQFLLQGATTYRSLIIKYRIVEAYDSCNDTYKNNKCFRKTQKKDSKLPHYNRFPHN